MAKKAKRKVTRKAPAKKARRANAKTAANVKRTARPVNGSVIFNGSTKTQLSEMAKAEGFANWKRYVISLAESAIKTRSKA